jgi:MFS family permease
MWSRDLVLVLAAVACLFFNYPILQVVGPVAVEQAGGEGSQAGFLTALFSAATVASELLSPTILTRLAPSRLLFASLALMAFGSLASIPVVDSALGLLALAPIRGMGFGAAVVAMSVLVTELAPPRRRGSALGALGVTSSLPSVFGPALGLALLSTAGAGGVFAFCGVATLVGAGLAACVRGVTVVPTAEPTSIWQGLQRRDLSVPFFALVLLSASYGGFISYAALALAETGVGSAAAVFLAYGMTRTLSRWVAGAGSERFGARPLALAGLVGALGALLLLSGTLAGPVLLAAGALFGAGQGLASGAIQVGMLDQSNPAVVRVASTMWNVGVDAGLSVGGAVLALVASRYGLEAVFRTLPIFAAASLLVLASGWPRARAKAC